MGSTVAMAGCFGFVKFCLDLFFSEREIRSNWEALPPELLRSVADRLSVPEYLRLRSVCTSWSRALNNPHCSLASRPWLMLSQYGVDHVLSLSDLQEGKSFDFPLLPGTTGKVYCVGCKDGWLAVVHELSIFLLNPFTGRRVPLPSFYTQPGIDHTTSPCVVKIVLSITPTASLGGSIAAMVVTADGNLAYTESTSQTWTRILVDTDKSIRDIVHHDGEFYIFCSGPSIWEQRANGVDRYCKSVLTILGYGGSVFSNFHYEYIDRLEEGNLSLVSTPVGLLQVRAVQDTRTKEYESFTVRSFDPKHSSYWVKVDGLGSSSLMVDALQSTVLTAASVAGLRENCIYFAKVIVSYGNNFVIDTGMFDVERGVREPCFANSSRFVNVSPIFPFWFKPSLS